MINITRKETFKDIQKADTNEATLLPDGSPLKKWRIMKLPENPSWMRSDSERRQDELDKMIVQRYIL